jgi:hypothetical protein
MTRSGQPRQGRLIGPKRLGFAEVTAAPLHSSGGVTSFPDFGLIESDFSDLPSSHPRQADVRI